MKIDTRRMHEVACHLRTVIRWYRERTGSHPSSGVGAALAEWEKEADWLKRQAKRLSSGGRQRASCPVDGGKAEEASAIPRLSGDARVFIDQLRREAAVRCECGGGKVCDACGIVRAMAAWCEVAAANSVAKQSPRLSVTGTELEVCKDIEWRQLLGIIKYGSTVADNPAHLAEWLQHAYEESLDKAIYLKRAIAELKSANTERGEG